MQLSLMQILIDPGLVPLIHAGQNDLAFHILAGIVCRAAADIDELGRDAVFIRSVRRIGCRHDIDVCPLQPQ